MKHDNEPTFSTLRDLRRAYLRQQYQGDLGRLVEPQSGRNLWRGLAVAAGLAICAFAGWKTAVFLGPEHPVAQQDKQAPAEDTAHVRTLELPLPPESLSSHGQPERRPVLPGLLVMSSPRATPPPRPTFGPRPSLSLNRLDAEKTSKQGPYP